MDHAEAKTRFARLRYFVLLSIFFCPTAMGLAGTLTYNLLPFVPTSINSFGSIVGTGTSPGTGVLDVGGSISTFTLPGSSYTSPTGINDAGLIVGSVDLGGTGQGFTYSGGSFSLFSYPGAGLTRAGAVNDTGEIVGQYQNDGCSYCPFSGYLYSNGKFTSLNFPGSAETFAFGINDSGAIVGTMFPSSSELPAEGFLYSGGTWTAISWPGAAATVLTGIDDSAVAVGYYYDTTNETDPHGFFWDAGVFTPLVLPAGGWWNDPTAISLQNQNIVGEFGHYQQPAEYFSSPGLLQGPPVGQTPEPSEFLLMGTGVILVGKKLLARK
jgi:hypothetical protein